MCILRYVKLCVCWHLYEFNITGKGKQQQMSEGGRARIMGLWDYEITEHL